MGFESYAKLSVQRSLNFKFKFKVCGEVRASATGVQLHEKDKTDPDDLRCCGLDGSVNARSWMLRSVLRQDFRNTSCRSRSYVSALPSEQARSTAGSSDASQSTQGKVESVRLDLA